MSAPTDAEIGTAVRAAREAKGWSQRHLAEVMTAGGFRWHQTTVGKTETGKRPLQVAEIAELAKLLQLGQVLSLAPRAALTNSEGNPVYKSRWVACDDCGCSTVIERDDERGVPDETEWDEFPRCLVCGSSQTHWNADQDTVADCYWRKGKSYAVSRAASLLDLLEVKAFLREIATEFSKHGDPRMARIIEEALGVDAQTGVGV